MKTVKFTLYTYGNFLVLLSTTVCSQNINKHNMNIVDVTLTDYSFLSIGITRLNQRIIEKTISNSSLNSHVDYLKKIGWKAKKRLFHIYSCFKQQKSKIRKNENERNKKMDSSMLVCNLCKFLNVICKISGLLKKIIFF